MGLYPQPNQWQCGPFALKHALIALGIFAEEKTISRIAGTHWWTGTDEIQLAKAAKAFNCSLRVIRRHNVEQARRELIAFLRKGIPVLLCVYEWGHWVTVVKAESGKFILLDSKDKAVLTIQTWSELKRNWVYHERDEQDPKHVETIFDFHPVEPHFRVRSKARFSIARAKYLRRRENRRLSKYWDDYVSDLLTICKQRTPLSERVFPMGEFLRRHGQMILDQVDHWHGSVNRRSAGRILRNMHLVADTYGLVIHEGDEKRAIAGITTILALWAAAEYGIHPVY